MSAEREVFLKIFAHSKDSVFLLDPQSKKVLYANSKSEEDTSYEVAELEGLPFEELFLEEDRPAIATLIETTLQWKTGVDPQRLLRRKTGRKLIVEITTSVVEWGEGVAVFCNVRDISARVKAEEKILSTSEELKRMNVELEDRVAARTAELAAQKLQLDDMMNHIQQAIFTVSPELTINSEHSRFVTDVFGEQEVTGRNVEGFLFPPGTPSQQAELVRDSLALVFGQPETWELVVDLLPKEILYRGERDLTLEWVPMHASADPLSAISKVMVICQDITERKKLQAQIAEQQSINQERMDVLAKMLSLPSGTVSSFMREISRLAQESQQEVAVFLEKPDPSFGSALLRSLHTLKGALGQLRIKSAATITHGLESLVQERLQAEETRARLSRATAALESLAGERVETLRFRIAAHSKELQARIAEFATRVEIEIGKLTDALEQLSTFYARVFGSRAAVGAGDGSDGAEVITVPEARIAALLEQEEFREPAVRKAMQWILQTPISVLFAQLEGAVSSTAQDLSREYVLEKDHGQVELDRRMIGPLYGALLHVVRNSVDHGGAGRSSPLRLAWSARTMNPSVIEISLKDDGNGIDLERIKSKAIEKGLKTRQDAEQADDATALRWIFLAGLSTQEQVTEISGRGVGMDQVLQVIEKQCGGTVQVKSKKGEGTEIIVQVPRELPHSELARMNYSEGDTQMRELLGQVFGEEELGAWSQSGPSDVKTIPLWIERPSLPSPSAPQLESPIERGPAKRSLYLAPLDLVEPAYSTVSRYFGEERDHAAHLLSVPEGFSKFGGAWLRSWNRSEAWSQGATAIGSVLAPGSFVHEQKVRDYGRKNALIDEVTRYVKAQRGFSGISELVGVACEELIMNAMFDAPRDTNGKAKYNHLPRTHALVLEESETVTLRYGSDAHVLSVSIEDPAGALSLPTLRDYLLRCLKQGADQVEHKAGGAGLGLYTLFSAANGLLLRVSPGRSTEVCVTFALCRSHKEYEQSGRALSFVTRI